MSRLLAAASDPEGSAELEHALAREARSLGDASTTLLLSLPADGSETLAVAAADPPLPAGPRTLALDRLPGVREALRTGAPLLLDGADAHRLVLAAGVPVRPGAALVLPAAAPDGERRYVLVLIDEEPTRFSDQVVEAGAAFASAAGASLEQVSVIRSQSTHLAQQSAFARAAKALNESLDLARVLPRICDEAAAILDAESVGVYRGTAARGLVLEASNGPPEQIGSRIEPGSGIAVNVMAAGVPMLTNEAAAPGSQFAGVRSALAAPLRWDGEMRGVLWVGYRRERRVTDDDLALLESFAELAAVACRNASVHASLAEAARTDTLTGCLNHGALHETLRREMQRSRRSGRHISIVMVDLDHFKQVNEDHGHLMGDEVLRRVGQSIREAVRPYDFVARYGGDEFSIVAVDAREERAAEIAERAITRLGASLDEALGAGSGPHATAGVAEWIGNVAPSELVRQADRALLYGKHQGVRGGAVRASAVPKDFLLGRPLAGEDARVEGPGPAPWPSALRRETEPLRRRTRQLSFANALGARLGEMTRTVEIARATVAELESVFDYWLSAVVRTGEGGELDVVAASGRGFPDDPSAARRHAMRATEIVERALAERTGVSVGDAPRGRGQVTRIDEPRSELAVPVWAGSELWGALDVHESARDAFGDADMRLLESVANQLGSALRSAALYEQLERAYLGTAEALAGALEAKEPQAAAHARSMSATAEAVGRRLGMDESDLRHLRYAAIFHGIGKVAVPEPILNKSGPLTDVERRAVERHTLIAEQILAPVDFLAAVLPLIRHCHEHWNGGGYPEGLAGERIPLGSRVILVCDAHQAMTTTRPYRRALPVDVARAELLRLAGSQFDPRVVEAFLAVVSERRAPAA